MEIPIQMNMNELINNIEKEINKVPKELNNLNIKGIHVFIYSLKKSLAHYENPLSELTPFNKFMLIINELIETINYIDYTLGEDILNNDLLTLEIINNIYSVRLEFCIINKEILNMVKILNKLNNETYIEYINKLINMIVNININEKIHINLQLEKLINNLKSLKLIEFKFIKDFKSKITIANNFMTKKIVNENLLLKLLNLSINISIHGRVIEILAYFKLFIHLIIMNEQEPIINEYVNILSYLNNFSKSININYSMYEIIGNIIIEYNNSIV